MDLTLNNQQRLIFHPPAKKKLELSKSWRLWIDFSKKSHSGFSKKEKKVLPFEWDTTVKQMINES